MVVVPIQWDLREGRLFVLLFDLFNVISCVGFFFSFIFCHSLICVYLQFLNLKECTYVGIWWVLLFWGSWQWVSTIFTFVQYFYSFPFLYIFYSSYFLFFFLFWFLIDLGNSLMLVIFHFLFNILWLFLNIIHPIQTKIRGLPLYICFTVLKSNIFKEK